MFELGFFHSPVSCELSSSCVDVGLLNLHRLQSIVLLCSVWHAANADELLGGVRGIVVPGGFGGRGIEGKIEAIRWARERGVPFLGLCLGMFMPLGLTVVGGLGDHPDEYIAWGWAVNGFFSVIGSVGTTILAMAYGFRTVQVVALCVYGVAVLAFLALDCAARLVERSVMSPAEAVPKIAALRADLLDHAVDQFGIQIAHHHAGAFGGELQCRGLPDAPPRAGRRPTGWPFPDGPS